MLFKREYLHVKMKLRLVPKILKPDLPAFFRYTYLYYVGIYYVAFPHFLEKDIECGICLDAMVNNIPRL